MGDEKLLREIGSRINAKRKELGYTQEDLAESMDVSIQMISNLELGKKAIRPENLIKLCKALNVSSDYVLTGLYVEADCSDYVRKFNQLSTNDQKLIVALVDSLLKE